MIQQTEFIEDIEAWGRDTIAIDNDVLLCAFVTLRLMTSEAFSLLNHRGSLQGTESLFKVLNNHIDQWKRKWMQLAKDGMHILVMLFNCLITNSI